MASATSSSSSASAEALGVPVHTGERRKPRYERRILVTGGAGFMCVLAQSDQRASHVVILLVKKYPQYKIVNFDKLDYCSSLKNLASVETCPNYSFVRGSILSSDLVNYVLMKENIDTIMHFAAQTHVDNSFGNSFTFTENNVLGTHVLLEAAKAQRDRVKLFIHVSTDEVYGEGSSGEASHEHSVLEPTNPYAASKAGAEYLVKAYHRSFGLPTIITRGNNVYGPHQYPEKIVPKFINQLFRGRKLTLHGTGMNTRNYLYVEDVARAFDVILHKGSVGDIYNIGGRNEIANVDVARSLLKLMGKVEEGKEEDPAAVDRALEANVVRVEDRLFNDLRYPLDCSRLVEMGWKEEVSWEAGLQATIDWYRLYSGNWEDVDSALVAHPRRGLLPHDILGVSRVDEDEGDVEDEAADAGGEGKEAGAAGGGGGGACAEVEAK